MAKARDPKVRVASAYAGARRSIRRPQHPFQLRTRPFQIQPFVIAPILPGETMRNALVQARVVTDPIKHPLVGWWNEYFLFYIKHRDINYHLGSNILEQMVLDPSWDSSTHEQVAQDNSMYTHPGALPFTRWCLETVVEWYFRDQGEDHDDFTVGGLPVSQITGRSWMDSLTLAPDRRTDRDVNLDVNDDGDITVREMMEATAHWQALREAGLEDMDYEDFLRTFGVQVREVDTSSSLYRPELIRYSRNWTYPTNTVSADPENLGDVATAASWSIAFRADKDRYFKEPGFLFGVTVARPKVYAGQQVGSLVGEMKNVLRWLPAVLHNDYEKGFVEIAGDEGPLPDIFEDDPADPGPQTFHNYTVDMRDLLVYGDQFVNFAADDASSFISNVTEDGKRRYPTENDIDNLFIGTANTIRQDGIVTFAISGRQKDRSPTASPL